MVGPLPSYTPSPNQRSSRSVLGFAGSCWQIASIISINDRLVTRYGRFGEQFVNQHPERVDTLAVVIVSPRACSRARVLRGHNSRSSFCDLASLRGWRQQLGTPNVQQLGVPSW